MLIKALVIITLCVSGIFAFAGGPGVVGGPAVNSRPPFGIDGQPFTWSSSGLPIVYRVDTGPMSTTSGGSIVIDHNSGVQRVQNMFAVWQSIPTAHISFSNAGGLLPAGVYTGGDLTTAQQFNDIMGSCDSGKQSPVIFDANGKLIASLGLPPEVIGFNDPCSLDTVNGYIRSSAIVMNGAFQDRVNSSSNFELTANEFDEAIEHEIGHFLGLDHSQINLDLLLQAVVPCDVDKLAGMPLMFPFAFCQARKDAGLPALSTDDAAWISTLYPENFASNYGTISGQILFRDGLTPAQGVNVIARLIDDSATDVDETRRVAVSVVSGYLFTGNPGQNVTATMSQSFEDNTNGSPTGSRNPSLIGYYKIAVPPGTYTVEVEAVHYQFAGGSSVGPLDPPVALPQQPEFWNEDESPFDYPLQRDSITVHAGENITDIDVILDDGYSRFDQYEDNGSLRYPSLFPLTSTDRIPA